MKKKVKSVKLTYPEDMEALEDKVAETIAKYLIKILPPEKIDEVVLKFQCHLDI